MLQEREKAKARRAKEKARARKLERQREREEAITLAEEQNDELEEQEGEAEAVGGQRSHRSPQSQDIKPPSRKPHMRATAIDSHTNDTNRLLYSLKKFSCFIAHNIRSFLLVILDHMNWLSAFNNVINPRR